LHKAEAISIFPILSSRAQFSPNTRAIDYSLVRRYRSRQRKRILNFLYAAQAIRAKNSKDDIYWCSSNNSTVCAIQSISVPVLFMTMGGHYYVGDGERYLDAARSKDKDFVVIEGATHGFTPCTRCERTPGQYANTVKNLFDYTAKWINDRF
jgi:hypothetical protein